LTLNIPILFCKYEAFRQEAAFEIRGFLVRQVSELKMYDSSHRDISESNQKSLSVGFVE